MSEGVVRSLALSASRVALFWMRVNAAPWSGSGLLGRPVRFHWRPNLAKEERRSRRKVAPYYYRTAVILTKTVEVQARHSGWTSDGDVERARYFIVEPRFNM